MNTLSHNRCQAPLLPFFQAAWGRPLILGALLAWFILFTVARGGIENVAKKPAELKGALYAWVAIPLGTVGVLLTVAAFLWRFPVSALWT